MKKRRRRKKKNFGAVGWKSYCNTPIALEAAGQAGALGAGALGAGCVGRWARRARGRWTLGERAQGTGACHAQARCRRTDARGARHERQVRWRTSGDTAMLACDTATAAATRRQCARPCTAWAWSGALAGPVGGSCSQFGFLPGFLTRVCFRVTVWTRFMNTVHPGIFQNFF